MFGKRGLAQAKIRKDTIIEAELLVIRLKRVEIIRAGKSQSLI